MNPASLHLNAAAVAIVMLAAMLIVPATADTQTPQLLSFSSPTANGTYGIGSAITINASYNELLKSTSQIVVRLNTTTDVTLSAVTDTIAPVHAGSLTDGGAIQLDAASAVVVSGNYAYITSFNNHALEIVDISDPFHPAHAGSLTNGTGGALLLTPRGVQVSGNYAYVASSGSDALEIVDISDPANPAHAGFLVHGTGGARLDDPRGVFVSGNYAYVASYGSSALEIVDISDPANPAHAGFIVNGAGGALLANASAVYAAGSYAYVAAYGSNALEIIDISTPASPAHAGSLTHGSGGALLANPAAVQVAGLYAYVAASGSNALEIVDVGNPASPTHAGSLTHGTGGALLSGPRDLAVSGTYAYVASYSSNALEIVDVNNPASPVHAASIISGAGGALLNGPEGVALSGGYAVVPSWVQDSLEIVKIGTSTISGTYTVAAGHAVPQLDVQSITSQAAEDIAGVTNASTTMPATTIVPARLLAIDGIRPVITITAPTKTSTGAIADTTVRVTDNRGINTASVLVNASTSAGYSGFTATQTSATQVDCTIVVTSSGDLIINATDTTGNTQVAAEHGYAISYPPSVTSITPATGSNNGIVTITNLTGTHFAPGASVKLMKTGETNITAGNVVVASPTAMSCTVTVNYVTPGAWTVVVVNPDGQEGVLVDGFTFVYVAPADTGGGGGGSSISTGAAQNIPAGTQADFGFTASRVAKVSVTAGEGGIADIIVTVEKVGGLPRNVDAPGTEILEYNEISPYRAAEDAIAGACIEFFVTRSDLAARGWNPGDIVMLRWHDGAWQQLETHVTGSDGTAWHYRAVTPGLSYFAIGYAEGQAIDDTAGEEPAPAETATPAATPLLTAAVTPEATRTPAPGPTASPAGLPALFAALAIGTIACSRLRRR
ncbi:MAG: PGF-pre-PGF domain-containing protein [Methanomicrobiales archaeon]|nr:PGF-pre-PGF domain-containing protein [Methanomicrobiales archaeon]